MTVREDLGLADRWLSRNALEYGVVRDEVKIGIAYFVMVWSLFDYRFLNSRGKIRDVLAFIDEDIDPDLNLEDFDPHFRYFRGRYLDHGSRNHRLDALAWNDYQSGDRIAVYLAPLEPTPKETVGALLLISYRLRCNLIHGSKWEDGIADQYENFRHATKAMMLLMDRY